MVERDDNDVLGLYSYGLYSENTNAIATIVIIYIVMAYTAKHERDSYHSCGLYSYGLYSEKQMR